MLFHLSQNSNANDGWIICGIGLKQGGENNGILQKVDWPEYLDSPNKLDGHFVIIKWDKDQVVIETDNLGLRDVYIYESDAEIIFTTRIDFLTKCHKLKLDLHQFSSRWLLYNQITNESVFENVKRIIAGRKAIISLNTYKIQILESNWLPDYSSQNISEKEYSDKLKELILITDTLTLGLSGGMDSRVILSYLLNKKITLNTFTFGNQYHPDSIIANSIVKEYNLTHIQFDSDLPSITETISYISDYSIQTFVNNAASEIFQTMNYISLSNTPIIMVDGGFGEVWRREFFYRLYYKEKQSIYSKNLGNIIPYLILPRADIFNFEMTNLMENSLANQLGSWFDILPSPDKIGAENWVDLFAIKTRLPNYYSHEQTRIDDRLTSIMPFAQQSLLNCFLHVPVKQRKNGKMFRSIIQKNFPKLKKYPLAKGNSTHPFYYTSLQSRILNEIKKKAKTNSYYDTSRDRLLDSLHDYIFDITSSKNFRESQFYDLGKVNGLIKEYYAGNKKLGYSLDWWLSFELFRQNFE